MQKKKTKHNSTYSFIKSLKNRLSFASKKKGFLSKEKDKVEVLELEEIEVLEEIPTEKVLRTKNDVVEFLDVEEPKLRRKTIRLKPMVRKRIQFASYALSAVCIFLFVFTFLASGNSIKTTSRSFLHGLGIYTEEIKNIEIQSNDYDSPGSWRIDKSAKWKDKDKVEVTLTLSSILQTENNHSKDIVLVMDTSGSMEGERLEKAIDNTKELIDLTFKNQNNRIAIITFSEEASIISDFTNDKDELLTRIHFITTNNNTNYNVALQKVNELLDNYQRENNKDLIVLFLTDGYPNIDTSSQAASYTLLKDKYPFIIINAIQYEMGTKIANSIKEISDNQWVADKSNLKNVLIEAGISPVIYEKMEISEFINEDFIIDSIQKINVSKGNAEIAEESGKVIWNFENEKYYTGTEETMIIELSLKSEYVNNEGFFPINDKETVRYQLVNETQKTVNSTEKMVLKNKFEVTYEANYPSTCEGTSTSTSKNFIYNNIEKRNDQLECEGYLFSGWEIDENDSDDIIYVNKDTFLMPAHDVHIKGTWTKHDIEKKMDGTVYERTTLYKVLENEAKNGELAKEYTGNHQDSINADNSTQKIYHYYAKNDSDGLKVLDKNNVIFANYCWEMVRTTDTGGVKMIYNGEVENGKCLNTRGNHMGYSGASETYLNSSYYYGTDYVFDSNSNTFKLSGTITTGEIKLNQYTCKSTNANGTCSNLFYIYRKSNDPSNYYYVISLTSSVHYSIIGTLPYMKSHSDGTSLSDIGYMYNKRYPFQQNMTNNHVYQNSQLSFSTTAYYADSISYNEETGKYILVNPYLLSGEEDYSSMLHKYTFGNTNPDFQSNYVCFITVIQDNKYYCMPVQNGLEGNEITYTYGDSYQDNQDGTYTIINPNTIYKYDYYYNYSKLSNKYICVGNDTCNELRHVTQVYDSQFLTAVSSNNYKYGSSFVYENGKYRLSGETTTFWDFGLIDNRNQLYNKHYTCFNDTGECESISYIYQYDAGRFYYINISDGKGIDTAINEMLYEDDVNNYDSIIKIGIDNWYKKNMVGVTDYIEETIFCNNREIEYMYGWDPNNEINDRHLLFKENGNTNDLSCVNETDRFSIYNSKAKLDYPVGLLSKAELYLLNNRKIREKQRSYWTLSPSYFNNNYSIGLFYASSDGNIYSQAYSYTIGTRPAISLKHDIGFISGDGSMEDPYIVDLEMDE